jgi:hypothetical protein
MVVSKNIQVMVVVVVRFVTGRIETSEIYMECECEM